MAQSVAQSVRTSGGEAGEQFALDVVRKALRNQRRLSNARALVAEINKLSAALAAAVARLAHELGEENATAPSAKPPPMAASGGGVVLKKVRRRRRRRRSRRESRVQTATKERRTTNQFIDEVLAQGDTTVAQLVTAMHKIGWTTSSASPERMLSSLYLRDGRKYRFDADTGKYSLASSK